MRSRLRIRPEAHEDHAQVRAVVATAFGSAAEANLVDAIRASEHYRPDMALVAALNEAIVGHVMISGVTLRTVAEDRSMPALAPLAVAPDHQRQGIGSALTRAVCAIAEDSGEPMVLVEGDPRYYSRFGFEPSYRYGIEMPLPDWAPREAGQVLRLAGFARDMQGTVIYPPAFDDVADASP